MSAGLIAYPARDGSGRQQIFTITADGEQRQQLTFEGNNWMPSWSTDGTRLVYVSAAPVPTVSIMNANGSSQHPLVPGDSPDWGPDDRIVYAASPIPNRPAEIFIVDAAGGTPRQVTPSGSHGGRVHPSWSPDGTHIVYVQLTPADLAADDTTHGCPALPARPELWIIAVDGTGARRLTTPVGFENHDAGGQVINSAFDANAPDWSPVGDDIAFWSGQESCYGQIWRIRADGTGRTQLTRFPIPSHNDDPAWSPDGRQILFSTDRRGRPELWVMDADGSNERFLAENTAGPGPGDAAWQPVPK